MFKRRSRFDLSSSHGKALTESLFLRPSFNFLSVREYSLSEMINGVEWASAPWSAENRLTSAVSWCNKK